MQGTAAGKYASQLLKASCASYTQRARSAYFVPVMRKMQNNRDFPLSHIIRGEIQRAVQGTAAGNGQPAAQSKLRGLHPKGSAHCKGPQDRLLTARYACFVPVIRKTQNNRNFTLSPKMQNIIDRFTAGCIKEKEEKPFDFSSVVSGCGGRDSNSHRITPTTPSK